MTELPNRLSIDDVEKQLGEFIHLTPDRNYEQARKIALSIKGNAIELMRENERLREILRDAVDDKLGWLHDAEQEVSCKQSVCMGCGRPVNSPFTACGHCAVRNCTITVTGGGSTKASDD